MPSLRKCCVVGCNSNHETHRLFNFPMSDSLRNLWLHFLVPVNIQLSGLSKSQLRNRYVCQKHFDRNQFDSVGNRLAHGYPCLFTEKEIMYGIPMSSMPKNHLSDHTYTLPNLEECVESSHNDINSDHYSEHNYASPVQASVDGMETISTVSQYVQNMEIDQADESTAVLRTNVAATGIVSDCQDVVDTEIINNESSSGLKMDVISIGKDLMAAENVRFIRKVHKIAQHQGRKPFPQRLEEANNLSKNNLFNTNFNKLNKQTQDFLLMQLKLANKKKKAMRYTMDEKLMSLSLMKESPKGYRLLQKIFNLPNKRTLNRLAEKINFGVGINDAIFNLLENAVQKWDTKKRLCSIIFDEVALMAHLNYVESQDEIKGFTDYGNEQYFKYCDHALVFMVKGVCSNWRQPIAYYFCEGTTPAPTIVKILKEIVTKISQSGLIPLAIVCDQGPTNRTAINTLLKDTERQRNLSGINHDGTVDIYGHSLNIVYDPPHLLKGLRNNLISKDMIFKGKIATWNDLINVYNADCQLGNTRMHKKLTDQHIFVEKMKKMKVRVAAQALSETTSAMLKYTALFKTTTSGEEVSKTMANTGEAVEFIDKLFDSVNGSKRGTVKGKLRGPIKPDSKHLSFWKEAKSVLKDITFVDTNSKRALKNSKSYKVRVPSLTGWITTLESFERLSKTLFEKYGLKYFYPRNINQDALENFFGRIRAINYRNVNPDAGTFINTFKSLLMSSVMGPHSMYANCEDDEGHTVIDIIKLLTQKKKDDDNKENVTHNIQHPNTFDINKSLNVANERLRVHSSAYTAGFICRRVTEKYKCTACSETCVEKKVDTTHKWIEQRKYSLLKNNNLYLPSQKFLRFYRDISGLIHNFLNIKGHVKYVGANIKNKISKEFNVDWLGCNIHKENFKDNIIKLILRVQIHNWCNIINSILKSDIQEKRSKNLSAPQELALLKFKARLKIKK